MTSLYIWGGVLVGFFGLIGILVLVVKLGAKAKAEKAYEQAANEMSREARQIDDRVRRASDDTLDRELRGDG